MKYACQWCFCSAQLKLKTGALVLAAASLSLIASHQTWAQPRGTSRLGSAQQPAIPSAAPQAPSNAPNGEGMLTDTNKDYLIAAGDVLEIWIEDAPELSRNYRVNAAGEFPMEVIGRVVAKQKTAEELSRHIATRLREEEFLVRPSVVVTMRQFNSQTFIVQGSVSRPGVYQLEGRPSLMTLIGLAGGLNDNHGSTAYIFRRKNVVEGAGKGAAEAEPADAVKTPKPNSVINAAKENAAKEADQKKAEAKGETEAEAEIGSSDAETSEADDYEMIKVNLGALYKGHMEHNLTLEPRDIINVPRADVFFVAGEVNSPGSYPLKDGTTLRQAISLAQGPTFKAKVGRGVIFRENPDTGKREEITVHIGDVMNGKKGDLPILPNDIIMVPNSRTKSISSALLTALGVNSARIPMRY